MSQEEVGESGVSQREILIKNISDSQMASEFTPPFIRVMGKEDYDHLYHLIGKPSRSPEEEKEMGRLLDETEHKFDNKINELTVEAEKSLVEIPEDDLSFSYRPVPTPLPTYGEAISLAKLGGRTEQIPKLLDKYAQFTVDWREDIVKPLLEKWTDFDPNNEVHRNAIRSPGRGGIGHYYSKIPRFLSIVLAQGDDYVPTQTREIARDYVNHILDFYDPDSEDVDERYSARTMLDLAHQLEERGILDMKQDEDIFERLTSEG